MEDEKQMPSEVKIVMDIIPANIELEIQRAKQGRMAIDMLFKELLVPGIDFDRIPGTEKPTLLKAGAELLCQVFHLAPGKMDILYSMEDFQNGFLSYHVGVPIYHRDSGILVSYGIGAANSKEPKYRYRRARNEDGEEVRTENPDPFGEQNTLIKMAAKRAFIDGVLKATGASRMFTQDMEDYVMPELASTKQKNFLRKLLKGKDEEKVLREVLGLSEDEEISIDNITREQAKIAIDALRNEVINGGSLPDNKVDRKKKIDWTGFWLTVKDKYNLTEKEVHELASVYCKKEVKSLKEFVNCQEDLDKFLQYVEALHQEPEQA